MVPVTVVPETVMLLLLLLLVLFSAPAKAARLELRGCRLFLALPEEPADLVARRPPAALPRPPPRTRSLLIGAKSSSRLLPTPSNASAGRLAVRMRLLTRVEVDDATPLAWCRLGLPAKLSDTPSTVTVTACASRTPDRDSMASWSFNEAAPSRGKTLTPASKAMTVPVPVLVRELRVPEGCSAEAEDPVPTDEDEGDKDAIADDDDTAAR